MKILLTEIMPCPNNNPSEFVERYLLKRTNLNTELQSRMYNLTKRLELKKNSSTVFGDGNWLFTVSTPLGKTIDTRKTNCIFCKELDEKYYKYNFNKFVDFLKIFNESVEDFCLNSERKNHYIELYLAIFFNGNSKFNVELIVEQIPDSDIEYSSFLHNKKDNLKMLLKGNFWFYIKSDDEILAYELGKVACENLSRMLNELEKLYFEFKFFKTNLENERRYLQSLLLKNTLPDALHDQVKQYVVNDLNKAFGSSDITLLWVKFLNKNLKENRNILMDYIEFVYYLWRNNFEFLGELRLNLGIDYTNRTSNVNYPPTPKAMG